MKEIKLPSGADLKMNLAPFEDSKNLYQALLEEAKGVNFSASSDMIGVCRDIFCIAFSSKKIEKMVLKCAERCLYNDLPIKADVFESNEARQDYFDMMFEIAMENVMPFTKSLYARYKVILEKLLETSHA